MSGSWKRSKEGNEIVTCVSYSQLPIVRPLQWRESAKEDFEWQGEILQGCASSTRYKKKSEARSEVA